MKKILITILVLFLFILLAMFFFKDGLLSSLNSNTKVNNSSANLASMPTPEEKEVQKIANEMTKINDESRDKFHQDPIAVAKKTADDLKSVLADETVSKEKKSNTVNALATLYCGFSRNPDVLPVIYSGEYEKFYVEGKPGASSRKMLEWGYAEFEKTPRIAVQIAHHGVKDLMDEKTRSSKNTFIDDLDELPRAKTYLSEAQKMVLESYSFKGRRDYYSYKFWLAFTEAGIAYLENDTEKYKTIYAELMPELEETEKEYIRDYIPYAYLHNTMFAMLAGEDEKNIQKMAQNIIAVSQAHLNNNNEFTQYIQNLPKRKPENRDVIDQAFYDIAKISPEFKKYMDEIIERGKDNGLTSTQ